jgi:class 3 adenylate cyclase/predicted Ser/Thr protein kinase
MSTEVPSEVLNGRYRLLRAIGEGGFGKVYLAEDTQLLQRQVVVKILRSSHDQWFLKKFNQEMEALTRLDHPGVVGILDTGRTSEGQPFLVMQFIKGETLRDALEALTAPMPLVRFANLIRQIAEALEAAHQQGIWHRDLKPENIMLQTSAGAERARLIDFGIAGVMNSTFQQGTSGTHAAGTIEYMAPEQMEGRPQPESDIFSLGIIAYEMATGRRASISTRFVGQPGGPPKPRQLRPELSQALEDLILQSVSSDPAARPRSSKAFAEALAASMVIASPATAVASAPPPNSDEIEIAHTVFTDLAGYSLMTMDQQKDRLAEFQAIVRACPAYLAAERAGQLVRLPTGDGMALVFSGDPTRAATCALEILKGLKGHPQLPVRVGLNTGPVYRIEDINGKTNVAGGGINTAQRVMDCADPGQALISKSLAEVLLQVTEWRPRLTDLGVHPVKHGVGVHIYSLHDGSLGSSAMPQRLTQRQKEQSKAEPSAGNAPPARPRWLVPAVLSALLILAGFLAWKQFQSPPQTAPSVPARSVVSRFDYSVTLTQLRNGIRKKPFTLASEVVFEKGDEIQINVTSVEPAYLYAMNFGPMPDGSPSCNLLRLASGSFRVGLEPGVPLRIPQGSPILFDAGEGLERFYLVYSKQPIDFIESLGASQKNSAADLVITAPPDLARVSDWLTRQLKSVESAIADKEASRTRVQGYDPVLVHLVKLEHH